VTEGEDRAGAHFALGEVGSTNDEALRLALAGAPLPLWVTAERQSAGRGRGGAAWTSEPGNLYASVALQNPPERPNALPFVAALALHDAASSLAPGADLKLKWPNDLLLSGAKLAGILAESRGQSAVVIGFGVNCAHAPKATRHPATSFAQRGFAVAPADLFAPLRAAFDRRLCEWRASGFAFVRAAWLARAAGIGGDIAVRLPHTTLFGTLIDLDTDGRLVLGSPEGVRRIAAGEVFLGLDGEGAVS